MTLDRINKIYNFHAKFYDLTRPFFLFGRKKTINLLNLKNNETVLDLACGTGLNISLLLKKTSPENITGIDYSNAMLEKAKKKYPYIKFIQGDISNYKFKNKFDKIICTYSLSIIDDWEKSIINTKKTLKNNGTFIILDFYKWKVPLKLFYPIFKWWLNKFEVNPEKNIERCLKENFEKVDFKVSSSGYYFISVARFPKN